MDDQLIITIEYETAPRADDFGELFVALARDYKDMTKGRVLVVSSIHQGSIWATLTDWALVAAPYIKDVVEFAKGAKALTDFGKLLKEQINGAKSPEPKKLGQPRRRKKTGHRSLEAIVKIAAEKGRAVRVKHTSANGETLEVEMPGETAILIREEALSSAAEHREDILSERLPRAQAALPDVKRALGQLYSSTAADLSVSEAQAVIDVVVEVLQGAGLGYILPQIAADLSNRGFLTLTSALAAKLNQSRGEQEPPLTSG
jgi:hypothetical protein